MLTERLRLRTHGAIRDAQLVRMDKIVMFTQIKFSIIASQQCYLLI